MAQPIETGHMWFTASPHADRKVLALLEDYEGHNTERDREKIWTTSVTLTSTPG